MVPNKLRMEIIGKNRAMWGSFQVYRVRDQMGQEYDVGPFQSGPLAMMEVGDKFYSIIDPISNQLIKTFGLIDGGRS